MRRLSFRAVLLAACCTALSAFPLEKFVPPTARSVQDAQYGSPSRLITRQYDALNRVTKVTDGEGQVVDYEYDHVGNLKAAKDSLGRITRYQYDALNRIIRIEDPWNGPTHPTLYGYDGQDRLTRVTDPRGLSTTYRYNGYGDLLELSSPDTGKTSFTYDEAGNLKSRTDARGVTATLHYDVLNRPIRVYIAAAPDTVEERVDYTYDSCQKGVGRLCRITDKTGITTYDYDPNGNVTAKTQTVDGLAQTVRYEYRSGHRVRLITPSNQVIDYSYLNGRPAGIAVNGKTVLSDVVYEPFGPVGGWQWGNSSSAIPNLHLRLYDRSYRPTGIQSDQPLEVAVAIRQLLKWDYVNRITDIKDPDGIESGMTYGYDDLDRLASTKRDGVLLNGYTYDGVGNRLTQTDAAGTTAYTYSATGNRPDALFRHKYRRFAYDAAGNLVSDDINIWRYGGDNRPYEVSTAIGTVRFAINALGQRVKKAGPLGTTRYVYDEGGRLIGEYDQTGSLIQEIVWLDELPVAIIRPGAQGVELYYVHPDHLGTPRAVTRASDNRPVWRWDNTEPFGNNAPNENPSGIGIFEFNLRFPGQYADKETGTFYNYFRDYDPVTGRYRQSDPIGLRGGMNTYGYVNGNPLSLVDPFGLLPGDMFSSPGGAAADAGKHARRQSNQRFEYGGYIFPIPGGYSYNFIRAETPRGLSEQQMNDLRPECPRLPAAAWHTHPDPGNDSKEANNFSEEDLAWQKKYKMPLYLLTPLNQLRRFPP